MSSQPKAVGVNCELISSAWSSGLGERPIFISDRLHYDSKVDQAINWSYRAHGGARIKDGINNIYRYRTDRSIDGSIDRDHHRVREAMEIEFSTETTRLFLAAV